ncbi:hypothetical protein [uncultured Xylophilus sp.]|uniref:hypothetical protein n=1 Tax=uncultured Xylophilus sp. TaxID=296832 RepID=UPI0025E29CBE|nr:hypothetical protein [uncultured Xylophilus sp.]
MAVHATDPTAPLGQHFGPPPFRFAPSGGVTVEGPAFSTAFRALATLIVGGCAAWVVRLWLRGDLVAGSGLVWVAAGLVLMGWTWWCVMTSRTRLGADGLHQRWIWDKQMPLRELAYCKLIRVRGLEWLIAPRLYARTLTGKFAVFYGASPALIAEFERLRDELSAFRRSGGGLS